MFPQVQLVDSIDKIVYRPTHWIIDTSGGAIGGLGIEIRNVQKSANNCKLFTQILSFYPWFRSQFTLLAVIRLTSVPYTTGLPPMWMLVTSSVTWGLGNGAHSASLISSLRETLLLVFLDWLTLPALSPDRLGAYAHQVHNLLLVCSDVTGKYTCSYRLAHVYVWSSENPSCMHIPNSTS